MAIGVVMAMLSFSRLSGASIGDLDLKPTSKPQASKPVSRGTSVLTLWYCSLLF